MNRVQRYLLVAALVGVAVALEFAFPLRFDMRALLILSEGSKETARYNLYAMIYNVNGVFGVLLGLIAPLCLFGAGVFFAFGTKTRK
jgi:hypothetical protein